MVMARIHIICGNCGAGLDDLTLKIQRDHVDFGDRSEDEAVIKCGNCSTLHFLSEYMNRTKQEQPHD